MQTTNAITRDELLDALDTEIEHIKSAQSSVGYTRWAVLLALAALLWAAIQSWEAGKFAPRRFATLAIALFTIGDLVLKVGSSLDKALASRSLGAGRFVVLSHLFGALRSGVAFHA